MKNSRGQVLYMLFGFFQNPLRSDKTKPSKMEVDNSYSFFQVR